MASLPVIVVQGGSSMKHSNFKDVSLAGVNAAARAGYACLQAGGSAMDAVVEAVSLMENNPIFNAGRGSKLTRKGTVEMDAIVMDGRTLASGAVSVVKNIANPVALARLVMEKTNHVCLTSEGASQFARAMDVPEVPEESLITELSRNTWKESLKEEANPVEEKMGRMGTVGAVAVDQQGNIASATSTGGLYNKMEGRVGDVSSIGCGAYADNFAGAVSPSGNGEAIMKVTLSRLVLFYMEQGKSVQEAADQALAYMHERVQGVGGLVVVDPKGNWAARFNSLRLTWAAAQGDTLRYGMYKGEDFTEPLLEPNGLKAQEPQ